ncbi:MAG: hypothetical protein A2X59_10450 [Nitrospirae bacterium GWC2_42_7]|nr:MAG: hypothetical protein A2X59_10450 [Nitrospirae bacterium GWC2_42_7]
MSIFFKQMYKVWQQELEITKECKAITPFFITGPIKNVQSIIVGLNPRTTKSCKKIHNEIETLPLKGIISFRLLSENYENGKVIPTSKDTAMRNCIAVLTNNQKFIKKHDKNVFMAYKNLNACKINFCSIPSDSWKLRKDPEEIKRAHWEWNIQIGKYKALKTIIHAFMKDQTIENLVLWIGPKYYDYIDYFLKSDNFQTKIVAQKKCWEWKKKNKRIILGPNQGFPTKKIKP